MPLSNTPAFVTLWVAGQLLTSPRAVHGTSPTQSNVKSDSISMMYYLRGECVLSQGYVDDKTYHYDIVMIVKARFNLK